MNSCASADIPGSSRRWSGKDQGPGPEQDLSTAVSRRATALWSPGRPSTSLLSDSMAVMLHWSANGPVWPQSHGKAGVGTSDL